MSPLSWLRGRAIPIVVCLAGLAALYVMLRMVALGAELALLITLTVLLFFVVAAELDFMHDHAFWRSMRSVANGEGPDVLVKADNVERPDSPHAQIAADALEAVTHAANAEVANARRRETEHREFVEAWVHEVKTPLAAAELLIENAREQGGGDPDSVRLMRSLSRELARIDGFVEQALFFARATAVDRDYLVRSCELWAMVGDAVKSRAHALIEAGVAVEMEGLEHEVFADPKWMGFVLGQLIDNAIKYRRASGSAADDPAERPRLLFKGASHDEGRATERVTLAVRDNGCGISAADIGRVFDKGFTGENGRTHAKSTGIGLYLVRQLCEKMGLAVEASSAPGAWTAIDITFPTNRMQLFE